MPSVSTDEPPTTRWAHLIDFLQGSCCRMLTAVLISALHAVLLIYTSWSHKIVLFSTVYFGPASAYYALFILYRFYIAKSCASAFHHAVPRCFRRNENADNDALAVFFWPAVALPVVSVKQSTILNRPRAQQGELFRPQ